MYNEKIEQLIKAALTDGVLTEKEKQILFKRAQEQGIDLDEFEMVLDARLVEFQKMEKEKMGKSAPKSNKFGDVRKCPVCGALVPALAVSCVECGYEFTGIEASSSAQKLAKLIADTSIEVNKRLHKNEINRQLAESTAIQNVVNSFPIPNMKEDLFDLMMFLKGQGYLHKFNECIERAKYLYPNDPLFAKIVNEKKSQDKKDIKILLLIGLGSIGLLLLIGLLGTLFGF